MGFIPLGRAPKDYLALRRDSGHKAARARIIWLPGWRPKSSAQFRVLTPPPIITTAGMALGAGKVIHEDDRRPPCGSPRCKTQNASSV